MGDARASIYAFENRSVPYVILDVLLDVFISCLFLFVVQISVLLAVGLRVWPRPMLLGERG